MKGMAFSPRHLCTVGSLSATSVIEDIDEDQGMVNELSKYFGLPSAALDTDGVERRGSVKNGEEGSGAVESHAKPTRG